MPIYLRRSQEHALGKVRLFMRKRAWRETEQVEQAKIDLALTLEDQKREVEVLEKQLVASRLELGRAVTNYDDEAKESEREVEMWEKELLERRRFIDMTKGFETFMQDTKDQTNKIELMANGELDVAGEDALMAKSMQARAMKVGAKFSLG